MYPGDSPPSTFRSTASCFGNFTKLVKANLLWNWKLNLQKFNKRRKFVFRRTFAHLRTTISWQTELSPWTTRDANEFSGENQHKNEDAQFKIISSIQKQIPVRFGWVIKKLCPECTPAEVPRSSLCCWYAECFENLPAPGKEISTPELNWK